MRIDPAIEGTGNGFLTRGKLGDFKNMAKEVRQTGRGLLVGFAETFLCDEEVGPVECFRKSCEIVRTKFFPAFESLEGGVIIRQIPN